MSSCGLTHHFWWLSPTSGQIAHVFLTRPPREPPEGDPVRLACIRHAASVDPEPGSNSPPNSSCSPDSSLPQNLRQSWCLLFSLSSTPVNTLSPASRPCSPCPLDQCASSASSSAPHPTVPGQNSVRVSSSLLNPRCQASHSPSKSPTKLPAHWVHAHLSRCCRATFSLRFCSGVRRSPRILGPLHDRVKEILKESFRFRETRVTSRKIGAFWPDYGAPVPISTTPGDVSYELMNSSSLNTSVPSVTLRTMVTVNPAVAASTVRSVPSGNSGVSTSISA